MTYTVSSGALNSTPTPTPSLLVGLTVPQLLPPERDSAVSLSTDTPTSVVELHVSAAVAADAGVRLKKVIWVCFHFFDGGLSIVQFQRAKILKQSTE